MSNILTKGKRKNNFKPLKLELKLPLWIYVGVNTDINGKWYSKMGQHICETREEAIKYAIKETFGKTTGLFNREQIVYCVNHTEHANTHKKFRELQNYDKYDDFIRTDSLLPKWAGVVTNDIGQKSQEIHFHDSDDTLESIRTRWIAGMESILNKDIVQATDVYTSRPFISDSFVKITNNKQLNIHQHLLAGCPGSGKETGTLSIILHTHDLYYDTDFNENTIHVLTATIPSTALELIKELTNVKGMVDGPTYYDYTRFKVYVLSKFEKSYKSTLTGDSKDWFNKYVEVISDISEIPLHPDKNVVPILIGSFIDMGLKASGEVSTSNKLKDVYRGLEERIGILSIGEAHQFLSKEDNKIWNRVNSLKRKFLLLVTGTPYDYIFNEEQQLYFPASQTSLFTVNDLLDEKASGNPVFQNYPNPKYFSIKFIFNEIEKELRKYGKIVDDDKFTWKKLLTSVNDAGDFKYKWAIIKTFKRLLDVAVNPMTGKPDGLSIESADLCDVAKRHLIFALPSGSKDFSVNVYIPKLVKLLEDNNALGKYQPLVVYDKTDSLSTIKTTIEGNLTPTVTFTCNRYLTGTDIPRWGSVVFLRPIGDSIKLFEQIRGRVMRALVGGVKPDCGIFIGELDEAMILEVKAQYQLSLNKGLNLSHKAVLTKTLQNYSYFHEKNGEWSEIEFPDLVSQIEEASKTGTYGVRWCIDNLKTPKDFDYKFKTKSGKVEVIISDNGNAGGKNKKTVVIGKQTYLKLFDKEQDRIKNYREMVKRHLARLRFLSYINGYQTIQEVIEVVTVAIENNDTNITDMIGIGVEFVPTYLDGGQLDIQYTNSWIHKLNTDDITINEVLELLGSKELHDEETAFYGTPQWLFEEMIQKLLGIETIVNPTVLDPSAGRGTSLITMIQLYKKLGIEIDTTNIYYNDIDTTLYKLFLKLNKQYNLGIPEKNIFNDDVLNPSNKFKKILMKKFDVVIGNPPYQKKTDNNSKSIWDTFVEKSFDICKKNGYVSLIHPSGWRNASGNFKYIQTLLKSKQIEYLEIHDIVDGIKTFGVETDYDLYVVKNIENVNKKTTINVKNKLYKINLNNLEFIPNGEFEEFNKIIAKGDDNCVNMISNSSYHISIKYMSETETDEFKYPCISTVGKGCNYIKKWYSSTNKRGHFGLPKVIFSMGRSGSTLIDSIGEYGVTQFAFAIVDEHQHLKNIKKAMDSEKFINLMKSADSVNSQRYNRKIISTFRKDFWKEFI